MGPVQSQRPLEVEERSREKQSDASQVRRAQPAVAGFEDGGRHVHQSMQATFIGW